MCFIKNLVIVLFVSISTTLFLCTNISAQAPIDLLVAATEHFDDGDYPEAIAAASSALRKTSDPRLKRIAYQIRSNSYAVQGNESLARTNSELASKFEDLETNSITRVSSYVNYRPYEEPDDLFEDDCEMVIEVCSCPECRMAICEEGFSFGPQALFIIEIR